MLSTLSKIGEQLLEGQGVWARLTIDPKTTEDKNQWVCPILFDCDDQEIRFMDLVRFYPSDDPDTEPSSIKYKYINPDKWGRRGRKCALTVEAKNFTMLPETFFGKSGEGSPMLQSMKEFDSVLANSELFKAIENIYEVFHDSQEQLDLQKIKEHYELGGNDEIVLFYTLVTSPIIRDGETIPLNQLTGFEVFFIRKFGTPEELRTGIDYVTGFETKETQGADFTGRYNIHKIFQTTTFNFASNFSDFNGNFRSSPETLAALDKASGFILKKWNTYIAGVSHIIVPSFLHKDQKQIDLQEIGDFILKSNELLFRLSEVEELSGTIEYQDIKTFWINYIAFESDGNSFKIMNHIKDVNSHYVLKLIRVCAETEAQFHGLISKYGFNLRAIYNLVPVREQKAKKNEALVLFKDILEQHSVDLNSLYKHFVTLIKCHWGGQFNDRKHRTYGNIYKETTFDYAAKNAVYNYLALIYTLKNLNLIEMQTNLDNQQVVNQIREKYPNKEIDEFLSLKTCSRNMISLFCLGRAVNVIGFAQELKGHKTRPILNKLNFNGMGLDDVENLSRELVNKGNQYQEVKSQKGIYPARKKVEEYLDLFHKYLDSSNWGLSNNETVFHLIAGYVFRPSKKEQNSEEETATHSN